MTKKTRRLIFYTFFFFFIVFTCLVILYAQGYGFDWQKKSLVITGAFYFESDPREADIYINNEYKGKTNKLIKRLLPDEYNIKISKPNYHDWQKMLSIDSKLITEAKNILLVKKKLLITQITNFNVKLFSFSNNKEKIVYLTDRATKEINPQKQRIADPREITTYSQFALRLLDLTNNTDVQINSSIPNLKNLSKISWSADDKKLLLFFPYNYYYALDLKNPSKIDLIKGKPSIDLNLNEQITAEIPKKAKETQLSDDNKKLLWRTENEIGVIWLEQNKTEIVMKTFEEISQAIWHSGTNQHIIFVVGNEIKITELDGRDKRNTVDILSIEKPEIFYNPKKNKLYILSEERLFETVF